MDNRTNRNIILVVDNEPYILRFLETALVDRPDLLVEFAVDVDEGYSYFKKNADSLLLLLVDIRINALKDGFDLIDLIVGYYSDPHEIPFNIIIYTKHLKDASYASKLKEGPYNLFIQLNGTNKYKLAKNVVSHLG